MFNDPCNANECWQNEAANQINQIKKKTKNMWWVNSSKVILGTFSSKSI